MMSQIVVLCHSHRLPPVLPRSQAFGLSQQDLLAWHLPTQEVGRLAAFTSHLLRKALPTSTPTKATLLKPPHDHQREQRFHHVSRLHPRTSPSPPLFNMERNHRPRKPHARAPISPCRNKNPTPQTRESHSRIPRTNLYQPRRSRGTRSPTENSWKRRSQHRRSVEIPSAPAHISIIRSWKR